MEYTWEPNPNLEHAKSYVYECDKLIKELSKNINIDIQYYEDLYDIKPLNKSELIKIDYKLYLKFYNLNYI